MDKIIKVWGGACYERAKLGRTLEPTAWERLEQEEKKEKQKTHIPSQNKDEKTHILGMIKTHVGDGTKQPKELFRLNA